MKTYLVLQPEGSGREAFARTVFLPEKFRWLALLFAPLWLLWHRLWLAFAGWLLVVVGLSLAAHAIGVEPRLAAPVLWLPTLFVAFEGSELIRRKLVRNGYREVAVLVAANIDEAEERFFGSRRDASPSRATTPPPAPVASPVAQPNRVVGLFPEPGGPR